MNTYFTRTVTLTPDEVGTIIIQRIMYCNELGEKRKRKVALNELARMLPTLEMPTYNDGAIKLLSISIGFDVNGESLVFVTYRVFVKSELES